jgi:hypothetical protein
VDETVSNTIIDFHQDSLLAMEACLFHLEVALYMVTQEIRTKVYTAVEHKGEKLSWNTTRPGHALLHSDS